MQTRTACGGCGSPDLQQFLDLGTSPLADNFPATPDEPLTHYPLRVAVCTSCWLAQLLDVVPDEALYGKDYSFYSSTSPFIVEYDRQFAAWAMERFPDQIQRGVVEIACNDGSLLRHFATAGVPALGIEPAAGPAAAAEARGLNVAQAGFTSALAKTITGGGLVIAKNVAAHVADLRDFLAGIASLIGDQGVAVIEVQYVGDLLAGNQIDHVYHEHRFFFSVGSLDRALRRHGLAIDTLAHTPAQGGSIRAVVRRAGRGLFGAREGWLESLDAYTSMQGRAMRLNDRLVNLLVAERLAGRTLAGYAATAKSATLLNSCGIDSAWLDHIVDTTPAKIGRYAPGTRIPIVGPGDRPVPDTYLLLAWNYLGDVLRRECQFTEGGGRFIVPIPTPVIL